MIPPVQECEKIKNANGGEDVPVDFGHQLALSGCRQRRQFIYLRTRLAFPIIDWFLRFCERILVSGCRATMYG